PQAERRTLALEHLRDRGADLQDHVLRRPRVLRLLALQPETPGWNGRGRELAGGGGGGRRRYRRRRRGLRRAERGADEPAVQLAGGLLQRDVRLLAGGLGGVLQSDHLRFE